MVRKQTFGEAVSEARSLLGISTSGAAGMLQMTEPLLVDIERGIVPPNEYLHDMFEKAYDIDLSDTVAGERVEFADGLISYDEEEGILQVENLGVRFRVGIDDNDVLLRGFSSAVRCNRGLAPDIPINLRAGEMPVLANLVDLTDEDLDLRARFWFGQDKVHGQSFTTLMRLSRHLKRDTA